MWAPQRDKQSGGARPHEAIHEPLLEEVNVGLDGAAAVQLMFDIAAVADDDCY